MCGQQIKSTFKRNKSLPDLFSDHSVDLLILDLLGITDGQFEQFKDAKNTHCFHLKATGDLQVAFRWNMTTEIQ